MSFLSDFHFTEVHSQPITSSSTSISYHPSNHHHHHSSRSSPSSPSSHSSICPHLRDNFRFDFALNLHISERQSADFRHYLLSKHHFLRFQLPTDDVQLTEIPIANQTLLEGINYDLGFSLLGDVEGVTKLCFFKVNNFELKKAFGLLTSKLHLFSSFDQALFDAFASISTKVARFPAHPPFVTFCRKNVSPSLPTTFQLWPSRTSASPTTPPVATR